MIIILRANFSVISMYPLSTAKLYVFVHLFALALPQSHVLLNFWVKIDPYIHKILNKVWGLEGCSSLLPPAHKSFGQVWFRRGYRARGFFVILEGSSGSSLTSYWSWLTSTYLLALLSLFMILTCHWHVMPSVALPLIPSLWQQIMPTSKWETNFI